MGEEGLKLKALDNKEFSELMDRLQDEAMKLPPEEWNWMAKLEAMETSAITHMIAVNITRSPTDYLKRLAISLMTLGYVWGKQEAEIGQLDKMMSGAETEKAEG